MMNRTRTTPMTRLFAFAGVLALSGCMPSEGDGVRSFAPLEAGDEAPEFSGTTLAGESVTIGGESDNVVLLNVWATWCVPCRTEMPDLEELYQEFGPSGFEVIAVSVDQGGVDRVQGFIDEIGTTFPIIHDPQGSIEDRYPAIGLPNTYLIDRSGTLIQTWLGPVPVAAARELIAEAVEG